MRLMLLSRSLVLLGCFYTALIGGFPKHNLVKSTAATLTKANTDVPTKLTYKVITAPSNIYGYDLLMNDGYLFINPVLKQVEDTLK